MESSLKKNEVITSIYLEINESISQEISFQVISRKKLVRHVEWPSFSLSLDELNINKLVSLFVVCDMHKTYVY